MLQSPPGTCQSSTPPQTVVQPLQTFSQPLQTVFEPQQAILQSPHVQQVPHTQETVLHPLQTVTHPSSTICSSPLFNTVSYPPLQHYFPSSLAAPQTSTMSSLNDHPDETLGFLLRTIARIEQKMDKMDQKMDQLMAEMGEMRNQQNALIMEDQPNAAITGIKKNPVQPSPVETPSNADTSADQFSLKASAVENHRENNEDMEADVAVATASSAGLVKTNSGHGNINEPQLGNQRMSDDFNFPISREKLIILQSKSSSTKNFSVHLLRELFTLEELEDKNISGSRGKDKVDPTRVEMIKEIVFKVNGTEPSHKEMVWRSCRQAMDAYIRRMKRENGFKGANQDQS